MNQQHSIKWNLYWISIPVILIVLYGIFEARVLLGSFRLEIAGVTNGQIASDPLIPISGVAHHASIIRVNDRVISQGVDGSFEDTLLLARGINVISFEAENRFGKKIYKTYTVLYREQV